MHARHIPLSADKDRIRGLQNGEPVQFGSTVHCTCTLEGNKKLCNLSLEIHPLLKDDDTGTTREADPREACNGESVQAFGSLHVAALSPTLTWGCLLKYNVLNVVRCICLLPLS